MERKQEKAIHSSPSAFEIDSKGDISCLATNKDFTLVVGASRQVFKVYSIEESQFTEKLNLRTKTSLNFTASDVVWSPHDNNIIASASSNGAIVFWDLNKISKTKQDNVYNHHERAVTRLCYHNSETLLLSGSKDGVCKLFDTRRREVVSSFQSFQPVPVLDIQWWPNNYFMFASATENGSIQIWDYRHTGSCVMEFPAHSGPVFALDFHPDDKSLLASGGRDKLIKVWRLSENQNPPMVNVVQTIASVSRVKWRPKRPTQISSTAVSVDLAINVWELQRPYLPVATFNEHREVVTSVIWKDNHQFLSGGKDSRIIMHSFRDASRMFEKSNRLAVDISTDLKVSFAITDKLTSNSAKASSSAVTLPQVPSTPGSRMLSNIFKDRTVAQKLVKKEDFLTDCKSSMFVFDSFADDFNANWVIECAKRYVIYGKPFEDMCQHNANVAADKNEIQIMKDWLILKIMFSTLTDPPAFQPRTLQHSVKISEVQVSNGERKLRDDSDRRYQENGEVTQISSDDESDDNVNQPPNQNIAHDFMVEDLEINEFDLDDEELIKHDDEEYTVPAESFVPSHPLTDAADPHSSSAYHNVPPSGKILFEADHDIQDKRSDLKEPERVFVSATNIFAQWDCLPSVISLLHSYADQGDVQTAVCMYIVLGNKIKSYIDEEIVEGWMSAYLDMLERFKLWCEAATITKRCNVKSMSARSLQSTTVSTACTSCQRPVSNPGQPGWYCKKCQKIISSCSICHTPVKGLFAWCQGCAHGGHIAHLKDWFSSNTHCPTGCGHKCEFS